MDINHSNDWNSLNLSVNVYSDIQFLQSIDFDCQCRQSSSTIVFARCHSLILSMLSMIVLHRYDSSVSSMIIVVVLIVIVVVDRCRSSMSSIVTVINGP
jgi:hypothetical protein